MIARVELYNTRMYARSCKTAATSAYLKIKQDGKTLYTTRFWDYYDGGWFDFTKTPLPAGNYTFEVTPVWQFGDVRDFTLTIYAPRKISIINFATKLGNETGTIEKRYISASKTYNNKVLPAAPIYSPKAAYKLTGVLSKDLIGARTGTGLNLT